MTKLHVFIDTNIFLNFFHYTNDDIEELKKIVGLIENKKIRLWPTEQVCQEFDRNRETKIQQSMADFGKFTLPGLPRLMAHYPLTDEYGKVVQAIKKYHGEFIKRAREEAFAEAFPADKLFKALIAVSAPIVADRRDRMAARRRTERNDPPGKSNSMGDRINWELLLAYVPDKTDIHIISKDGDFSSLIDASLPHPVLVKEWKKKNSAVLHLYTTLKAFTNLHFPDIKMATDIKKRDAIDALKSSGSFGSTHAAVSGLTPFIDLITADEADELVNAGLTNDKIRWIGTDPDVKSFYGKITESRLQKYLQTKRDDVCDAFGLTFAGS